jgi:amidase
MKRISRESVTYFLDASAPPVLEVTPGERVTVETHDCRTGTITSADQVDLLPDLRFVNPATGPIAVAGAQPGDVVRVEVHDVRVVDRGLMIVRPETTAFDDVSEPHLRIVEVRDGFAQIGPFRVALAPMIGVIGVAPPEPVRATLGGPHGGNMDTRLIGAGATVYLPVYHAGAGLYLGDVHAAQGDGEVFLTGVEIAAEVDVTIDLVKDSHIPTPLVETADVVATVATATTLDEACTRALRMARDLLVRVTRQDPIDVGFLMSAACNLRVSQFLPGASIHARVEIPKSVLAANGYSSDPLTW